MCAWRARRLLGHLPRALDRLQRDTQLRLAGAGGHVLDRVAIAIAALKVHLAVDRDRIAVQDLLDPVGRKALEKAAADQAQMEALAADAGSNEKFAAWDWRFWQEKLRAKTFAFDEAELKPYLQLDHVIAGQSDLAAARDASERSVRWLVRARQAWESSESAARRDGRLPQALFPIVQGGIHPALRREAARAIRDAGDWAGYAIGGLSVGEAKLDMYAMIEVANDVLPDDHPRYLMGVGFPEDLIEGIRRGVDLFDCVAPTRMGRTGTAFTSDGRVNVRNAKWRVDPRPLDARCACSTCRRFSRAYLRHLFVAGEVLGLRLLSLHNVHFLIALARDARCAIEAGTFDGWSREWLGRYHSGSGTAQ